VSFYATSSLPSNSFAAGAESSGSITRRERSAVAAGQRHTERGDGRTVAVAVATQRSGGLAHSDSALPSKAGTAGQP